MVAILLLWSDLRHSSLVKMGLTYHKLQQNIFFHTSLFEHIKNAPNSSRGKMHNSHQFFF